MPTTTPKVSHLGDARCLPDVGPAYADSSESLLATTLRAHASHFWSTQENKYWKNRPGTKEHGKKKQKGKHGKLLV